MRHDEMTQQRPRKRIGLLDHMGGGNLGDDATQTAVIRGIKRRWPAAEIVGLSLNPEDTEKRHGIQAYAIRTQAWRYGTVRGDFKPSNGFPRTFRSKLQEALEKCPPAFKALKFAKTVFFRLPKGIVAECFFLFRCRRIIKQLDILVISGGGQLLDCWGGPWGFPYTILKWILLAERSSVRRMFLNVGAGPLEHPLSIFFIRRALRSAEYVSLRDPKSKVLLQSIGFAGRSEVVTDSVYNLEPAACLSVRDERDFHRIVAISPMAYCDPRFYWKKDQQTYDSFIRKLSTLAAALVGRGYRIMLLTSDICFDRQAILELKSAIESHIDFSSRPFVDDQPVDTAEEFFARLSTADYVVTCRFHGVVFAHLLRKPLLAISHHQKVSTLMEDMGLADYCIDIRNFDPLSALKRFDLLVMNADKIKSSMEIALARYRSSLASQFDILFPPEPT